MDNVKKELFNRALGFMKRGWSIIPVKKDKIPCIPWREFQTRFATEEEILKWIDTYPDMQIGIVTGKISNLTVVDIEEHGDPSFLPQDTLIVHTGGNGYHYYFSYEPGVTNKARIRDLVDIRSEGGYVVAPESVSDKGKYEIVQEAKIIQFPKELFPEKTNIWDHPSSAPQQNFSKEISDYPGYGKGQRNDEMTKYVGYVLTQIHPFEWETKGWSIIEQANQKNNPPLNPRELRATFDSIKRIEMRNNPTGRRSSNLEAEIRREEEKILVLGSDEDKIKHIAQVAAEHEINIGESFPLDMPCFDDVIDGGVNIGDVIAIAGYTGNGKTTLAQDWSLSLNRGKTPLKSLWFSYEVLPQHLWKKFTEMGATEEDYLFTPAKNTTGNVEWIENKIKEGKEQFGIKAVFIDHLGFLLPKTNGVLGKNFSSNYAAFLTQIMRDLKTIAKSQEVIIFLPVHMKKGETRARSSDLDDIKDSSGIAQEADLVFLIERERNTDKNASEYYTDITKITLAKNRKTGKTVIAKFTMLNNRFAYSDINVFEKESINNYAKIGTLTDDDDEEETERSLFQG